MNKYIIYAHIFPNNKIYVGQTSRSLKERFKDGEGYVGQPVYAAIKKYGWDNIQHIVLKEVDTFDEANYWEKYYIKYYNSNNWEFGYNLTEGGQSFSESASRRVSKYDLKGNFIKSYQSMTEACLDNNFDTAIGISGITHCCKNEAKTCFGFQWSYGDNEIKKEPIAGTRGNGTGTSVDQYSLDGKFLRTFKYLKDVNTFLKNPYANRHVSDVCRGKRKTAYGYIWKFHNLLDE